jgi:hypothetical protein
MNDDWRIRIELEAAEHATGLLGRLGLGSPSAADELAADLRGQRLAVSQDDDVIFVYAASRTQAESALRVVESELTSSGTPARTSRIEHWLHGENRWDDDPAEAEELEAEALEHGYAPWEVRVECASHEEAEELARRLESEGHGVVRRARFVLVGAPSEGEARTLASRLHGEVEAGGELVYEVTPQNPFAVFGGLGGAGTPL